MNRTFTIFVVPAILLFTCLWPVQDGQTSTKKGTATQSQKRPPGEFKPARFKWIEFGKSREADLIRAFGKPRASGLGTDKTMYHEYDDIWLLPGGVSFMVDPRDGIVHGMSVRPERGMHQEILKLLGPDYIEGRYDVRAGDDEDGGDGGIFYRHPNGTYPFVEYPQLGIVIHRGSNYYLFYSSHPFSVTEDPSRKKPSKQGAKASQATPPQ